VAQSKSSITKWVFISLGVLVAMLLGFATYMGVFHSVHVVETSYGPARLIYSTHRGPYEDLGASWERFQKQWQSAGLTTCHSLAIYLDAPDTPPQDLRSILGCEIGSLSQEDHAKLSEQFPVFEIPKMEVLSSQFPYRNMFSFMLGPMKVYPEIQRIMEEQGFQPAVGIEVYGDPENMETIQFILPKKEKRETFLPLEEAFR